MPEIIKDPIKVGAIFTDAKIIPKWFVWGRRRFDIASVNYTWKTKEGRKLICHFAVTDSINVFELSYDTEDAKWELVAIDAS